MESRHSGLGLILLGMDTTPQFPTDIRPDHASRDSDMMSMMAIMLLIIDHPQSFLCNFADDLTDERKLVLGTPKPVTFL
jgi:hypothetical protein